jgi:hypothetical protein
MMLRKSLFILFLSLLSIGMKAQDVNVVVLESTTEVTCDNAKKATCHEKRIYKILNEKGADAASISMSYESSMKMSSFSGLVTDENGRTLKKIKRSDLQKTELSLTNFATDIYTLYYQYVPPVYPIIITYEWEDEYTDGYMHFPVFQPQDDYAMEVKHSSYKLTLPQGATYHYKALHTSAKVLESTDAKGRKVLSATMDNLPAISQEPKGKSLRELVPVIFFSPVDFEYLGTKGSLKSWKDFGQWYWSLLEGRQELPVDFKTKLHQLTDTCKSARSKLAVIYNFLEKTTRYVSIQLGIGGQQPIPASDVCRSGFGDCKGLSNYMRAMLKEVGIPSSSIIIGTKYKKIMKELPGPIQFNHAILMVPMQKDTVWVECTAPSLPLGYIHKEIAGHDCIEITPQGGQILIVPEYADSENLQKSVLNVDLKTDGSAEIDFNQKSYLLQYENTISLKKEEKKKQCDDLLSDISIPQASIKSMSIDEHKESFMKPHMDIKAQFSVPNYASGRGQRLFVPICPVHRHIATFPAMENRKQDIENEFGFQDEDEITLNIPEGYEIEAVPKDISVDYPFGSFTSTIKVAGRKLIITNRRLERRGTFSKDLYKSLCDFHKLMFDQYNQNVILVRQTK